MKSPGTSAGRIAVVVVAALGLVAMASSNTRSPCLVFNASDSVPRGWYAITAVDQLRVGEVVLVRLPGQARAFAAQRGYLPIGVPLLKPIAALAGQRVCIQHGEVYVDGHWMAQALARDGHGRKLPAWCMCRALGEDEVFLLATHAAASFDSRYFGPIDRAFIRGRASPITASQ
jgi:conjugative transfer signal peptidase TraF